MADHYAIASEFFQQVLEKRRREGELSPPPLDLSNRRRYALPASVVREAVMASRPTGISRETWDALRINRRTEG